MTDADHIGCPGYDASPSVRVPLTAEEVRPFVEDAVGRYPFHRDPEVRAFLTRYVVERYRPATRAVARGHIDAAAWLYHIGVTQLGRFGIAVTMHRFGFDSSDQFAHEISCRRRSSVTRGGLSTVLRPEERLR